MELHLAEARTYLEAYSTHMIRSLMCCVIALEYVGRLFGVGGVDDSP